MQDKTASQIRDDLLREGNILRKEKEPVWDRNMRRYMGDHWDRPAPRGRFQFTDNRIQTHIVASTSIQTEQRPRMLLTPVETSAPPVAFLSQQGAAKAAAVGIQATPDAPIDNSISQALAQQVDPLTGQPLMTPADLILIDDATKAKCTLRMVEYMWDRGGGDFQLRQNVLNKSVVGHQPMLVQFNLKTRKVEFINVHPRNVWIDPTATGIEDADWVIYAQVLSRDEAVAMFPGKRDKIDQYANQGPVNSAEASIAIGQIGEPYQADFQRKMIVLWTIWLRHQEVGEMTPEAALEAGLVEVQQNDIIDAITGQPSVQEIMVAMDGTPTEPGAPNWPKRIGIEQIQLVSDEEVFRGECPYADIPIAWNINLPEPFGPYGIGEPERLEDINQFINRQFSNLHDHYKYFSSPQQIMAQSVRNALGDKADGLFSSHGRTVVIDDDVLASSGGKAVQIIDPPSLPQGAIDALVIGINEFKEQSGNTDAMMGNPNSQAESGKAILALQGAARGVIGYRALFTEQAVTQIVRILVGIAKDFLTPAEWGRVISEYPPEAIKVIKAGLDNLDLDIRVEVQSGRAANKQVDEQNARMDYQMGLETRLGALERMGRPDAKQKAAELDAQQAMQAAAQPEQPKS